MWFFPRACLCTEAQCSLLCCGPHSSIPGPPWVSVHGRVDLSGEQPSGYAPSGPGSGPSPGPCSPTGRRAVPPRSDPPPHASLSLSVSLGLLAQWCLSLVRSLKIVTFTGLEDQAPPSWPACPMLDLAGSAKPFLGLLTRCHGGLPGTEVATVRGCCSGHPHIGTSVPCALMPGWH